MTPDCELLRQYARTRDDQAFAEVVRRNVDLVYSVARRLAGGDSHLAEDVTQGIFIDLARKAQALSQHPTLAGWLHRSTRYATLTAIRASQRRRVHEQEATTMQELTAVPSDSSWAHVRPLLDEAVDQLGQRDREAVLLRFFHGKSHQEIGAILGLSENSANKRVERALEKLRGYFAKRGVATTSVLLAEAIGTNSVQAAPAGLAANTTQTALAASTAAGTLGGTLILTLLYMSTKSKTVLAVIILLAIAGYVTIQLHISGEASIPTASTVSFDRKASPTVIASPVAKVAAPILGPASPSVTTETSPAAPSTPTLTNDPQSDLSTAIPDLINLIQTDQLRTAIRRYMPPSYFEQMPQAVQDQLEQQEQNLLADPNMAKQRQVAVSALQSMLNKAPDLNQAGDHATYHLDTDPNAPNHPPTVISFIKVDGRWYLEPGANALFF